MSVTITLDRTYASHTAPRTIDELVIDLDRPDVTPLQDQSVINILEELYLAPAIVETPVSTVSPDAAALPTLVVREVAAGLATFAVDATCLFVALAAAMPGVPRFIGKPIYTPLVRRICGRSTRQA